jgi:arylsulfatase A
MVVPTSIAQKQSTKPNIILIIADDLGYGDLGCYGQQKIKTPNIDKLAKNGMRFTQFYSGTSVCAPARASLMSGLHTGHTAVRGNRGMQPEGQFPLPASVVTFPMLLKKAGYLTAAFGKWGLGFITTTGDPMKKGFEEFYGYNCQSLAHNYYPSYLWHNHERIDLPGNLKYDSIYSADLIHQKAMLFLKEEHNRPFFLFLPYTLPHADVSLPHDSTYHYYVKKFGEPPSKIPARSETNKNRYDSFPHAAFASMVARLDNYVGEIMTLLRQKNLEENTWVIFTSDNGPHQERGGDPEFFDSKGILRGIKRDLYEGGIRAPFIAYRKGITKVGSINDRPAALWDLYPTFLEIAGQAKPKNIDGISILPALTGKSQPQHQYFYWELHEGGGKQAVRFNEWKGVRLSASAPSPLPIELYNLNADPGEKNNVAAQHPDIVKKIEAMMKEAHVANIDWPLLANEKSKNQ